MIKREIREFKIKYGNREIDCQVPFSLRSVLGDEVCERVTVSGEIEVASLAEDGFYLRLYDLPGGVRVLINGSEVYTSATARRAVALDIKPALTVGINTLDIAYDGIADGAAMLRPVELIRTRFAIISGVHLTQKHETGKAVVGIRLDTLGVTDSVRAVATLVSGAGQIYYAGLTGGRGSITVNDPLYWWPKGLGVQNLYKLTVNLYGDMEIEDTAEMKMGIRHLTTANSADGSLLEVNGTTFVPMGATYRQPDGYDPAVLRRAEQAQIGEAARAGFNTLVIPADSPMPDEYFLELCDAHGIVAVRECADIDRDLSLLTYDSYHPSVGIVDIVGAGESLGDAAEKLQAANPGFEFSSEESAVNYPSYPSLPCYKTLVSELSPGERNPYSEAAESDGENMPEMVVSIGREYLYPSGIFDFAYASQLCAAQAAEQRIADARINRGSTRAVISELCDLDSLVSASVLDNRCRPKAVAYRMASCFSPIAAFVKIDGTTAVFTVSNEARRPFIGVMEYRIIDNRNRLIYRREESCVVEGSQVKRLFAHDLSEWVAGHEREYYLEYILREGNGILSCGTLLFVPAKRFNFIDPEIKANIVGDDRRFTVTLSAAAYARAVELDFEGVDAVFHENYIDITSQSPIKISFSVVGKSTTAEYLMSELKIRSVYDIGAK